MATFLHNWISKEDVISDFWPNDWHKGKSQYAGEFDGAEILLASYSCENYSGDAFVLFERDGKLYEVNGGHCSCYGLEGQWDASETTKAELLHRLEKCELGHNDWYGNEFAVELVEVLAGLP